jgi:hypothetical protein
MSFWDIEAIRFTEPPTPHPPPDETKLVDALLGVEKRLVFWSQAIVSFRLSVNHFDYSSCVASMAALAFSWAGL